MEQMLILCFLGSVCTYVIIVHNNKGFFYEKNGPCNVLESASNIMTNTYSIVAEQCL